MATTKNPSSPLDETPKPGNTPSKKPSVTDAAKPQARAKSAAATPRRQAKAERANDTKSRESVTGRASAAGSKKRKPFPVKIFLLGLAALSAGVLIFVLASGNEPLTFLGFALVFGGLLVPAIVLLRRVLRKIFFWIPAALIAFAIIFPLTLSAYVVFFFPNETVRQVMQSEMGKALNRPVSIGSLNISLLEGITLDKLVIKDRDGESPFVSASLVLSYKLLPILTGNLIVTKAVLESPSITVTRKLIAGKAVLSIDDLLAGGGGVDEPEQIVTTTSGGIPSIPFAISVGEIGLRSGSVTIEDQATKGFAQRYTLDKLDCLASDITWPMTQPLGVRFAFRIAMEELGAPTNTAKAFSVNPGIKGRLMLRNSAGTLVPEGRIDFFAEDGLFYGQQFLTKAVDFLETLKRDFFSGIQREAEKRLDQFDADLKKKVADFSGAATKQIDSIIAGARGKLTAITNDLAKAGSGAIREFDSSVMTTVNEIDAEVKKLDKKINDAFSAVTRVYPAARTKIKLETYTSQAKTKVETVKKEYSAYGKGLADGLAKDVSKIIDGEQKRFDTWANTIKNSLDDQIEKYASTVRNEFRKQLANVRAFVDKFELDIPFLRKRMTFDKAQAGLSITNGRMAFSGLSIGGKEFRVTASGSYGLLDGSIDAEMNLSLDARHASNPLIGIFAGADGRPEVGMSLKTVKGELSFSLVGPPLVERMKELATDKAKEYMNDYLAKNVNLNAFLSKIGGGEAQDSSAGKSAITTAKRSRTQSLQTEKNRKIQSLADEGRALKKKIEDDAKKALTQVLPGGLKKPF
jgi:hypothetical protein